MKSFTLAVCSLTVISGCVPNATSSTKPLVFHTNPNNWQEPRVFQMPFEHKWTDRIKIERVAVGRLNMQKKFSPNGAYWYSIELGKMHKQKHEVKIYIYNERDYIVSLVLLDKYLNSEDNVSWVNEKLLYVRVWWGRILGMDMIFDVEKEEIIYLENVNDGGLAFLQWQQANE